jgi:hypothetical protein
MASDRLVTSFDEDSSAKHIIDLDAASKTQNSTITDYGSDLDFSWTSHNQRGSISDQIQKEPSDYGDFDSDDERVIASFLDNANNLASQPLSEAALQNDAGQSIPRALKPVSTDTFHSSAGASYHAQPKVDSLLDTTSHYHRMLTKLTQEHV